MPDAAADVYIALQDDRGVPSLLDDDWIDTGSGIATCEGSATRTCGAFRKRVNAGTVMLGHGILSRACMVIILQ